MASASESLCSCLGCTNHCRGCQNPQSWDFGAGKPFTDETMRKLLKELQHPHCRGLSLSGGDPLNPLNAPTVAKICETVKRELPDKDIWCWTGYKLESILDDEVWSAPLKHIDYVIDGRFVEELKDLSLLWRGSSNQRIWEHMPLGFWLDVTESFGENA